MEDKKMTEKESLELITQMIQNSKKKPSVGECEYSFAMGVSLCDNCACGLCSDFDNW